jgi:cystathionine beta-synthase
MDVLVVIDGAQVPARLSGRARRRVDLSHGPLPTTTIAELRAHIPRSVGVVGPDDEEGAGWLADTAGQLHRSGLPVIAFSDRPVALDPGIELLAKLEFLNPGGSVKDRPALSMIEAAEREGRLAPGGTIVEPTSGNTGVGLAIVAARKGYRCVFTMPDKIAKEKVALLRAYGAEVVVCPTAVDPSHPDSYYSVARRLTESTPGAYQPDQYSNPHNAEAHERSTGPEIWEQTSGRVTHLVASIGTGGTISGVGRYLKSRNPAIRVIGADPQGSVYSGGQGRPYLVEGIGEDFWPDAYDRTVPDEVVMVTDRDSFLTARRITREEGILVGGSAGTAVWAALEVGRRAGPEAVIVVIIPDSGRGYLTKLYDDGWMADHGFLRASSSGGDTVGELLIAKARSGPAASLPPLVHVHPDESIRDAIAVLREYGVSQMPVVKAEPPLALAEVVGTVTDRELLGHLVRDPSAVDAPVSTVMGEALPMVGSGEPVDVAAARLAESAAVLVIDSGHPTGIITRSDLLDFLSGPAAR